MPASCVLIGAQVRVHNPKELYMASVLITGTSKGIGFEAALAFGRAGYKVHATMRNPSQSPGLAETAAREKLPITVSAMDVDTDESVRQAIAAIERRALRPALLDGGVATTNSRRLPKSFLRPVSAEPGF